MKSLKRVIGITVGASLAFTSLIVPLASAHVLKEDNGISSVMHIDPDDNPVAGVSTTLEFDYGNNSGSFALNNYEIDINVTQNNKSVVRATVQPAYFGSASQGNAVVKFPSIGVYNVIETGKPLNSSMPAFRVTYLVRVATSKNGKNTPSHGNGAEVLLLSATGFILLVMIAIKQIDTGRKYSNAKTTNQTKKNKSNGRKK